MCIHFLRFQIPTQDLTKMDSKSQKVLGWATTHIHSIFVLAQHSLPSLSKRVPGRFNSQLVKTYNVNHVNQTICQD